jgi:Sulfotransferase domain
MKKSMVVLASYPRSGNTFFRLVARLLFSLGSEEGYEFHLNTEGMGKGRVRLIQLIGNLPPEDGAEPPKTRLLKTHDLPCPDDGRPAIYLVRDGRDAYVSFAHFMQTHFPDQWNGMTYLDALRALISRSDYFGGWSQNVRAWTSRAAPTAVVRFEKLIADPSEVVAAACRQVGMALPQPAQGLPSFEELSEQWPEMFRRGKVGGWKDEMPPEVEDLFWFHHGKMMTQLGYPREHLSASSVEHHMATL